MTRQLTARQRTALAIFEAAHAAGQGLSAYARSQGYDPRKIHDAITGLRRRGALPGADQRRSRKGPFMSVRVVSSASASSVSTPGAERRGAVCRLMAPQGVLIECAEWPPAAWLRSLGAGDAAP